MPNVAVFLDRDGTINIDKGYVHRIEDWEWVPGAIESLIALKSAGFLVIVVTNQAGIARGYYDKTAMEDLHAKINHQLQQHGAQIDGFYHCPHHPEFGEVRDCECRKPLPGMILKASQDYRLNLSGSWLIGDKVSDIQSGLAAGVKSILVKTGYGNAESALLKEEVPCVENIEEAARYIFSHLEIA